VAWKILARFDYQVDHDFWLRNFVGLSSFFETPIMNFDAITTVNDSLRQIQEVTSSWDDDGLGDEEIYKACDESMVGLCLYINYLGRMFSH